ncbi:tetratricopeptide repeat protein 23 [Megalops cyprinoides]|uniref:tetratricopeptide repeat protein 23 n=1 Tax=Megalops cyprinoides TaxID=118141 RepID=UPI0018651BB8|nr:tetratricopeptide repeat protein 23 [Megalops cyprinoides]
MDSVNTASDSNCKSLENCLAERRESTGDSSSGGSARSAHSEKGPSARSHREAGEALAAVMMSPEEKLAVCETQAQTYAENQQFDAAIQELVRCLALVRLVHGDGHLKLAQAHAKLAQSYLEFKGWAVQAQEHSARALEALLLRTPCSPEQEEGEKADTLRCLLSVHHTQGQSALLLAQSKTADRITGKSLTIRTLEEAKASLGKAERIVGDLRQLEGGSSEETAKTEFEITTGLSRLYQRQRRPQEALIQCERALKLLQGQNRPSEVCAVYRDMATIEQAQGRLDRATQHLLQARSVAQSQNPGGVEQARIAHSLALTHSASGQPEHIDSALRCFEESLEAYRSTLGPENALTLSVQDDLCRLLLLIGQQESAVKIQRESLPLKRSVFGDLSAEVAETLQLIAGVEMTQGDMRRAHRTMSKCLEIQVLLLGPQHKKTRAAQRTVDMLSEAPEVAGRQRKASSLKARPPFCAVVPSHNPLGGTNVTDS